MAVETNETDTDDFRRERDIALAEVQLLRSKVMQADNFQALKAAILGFIAIVEKAIEG